MSVHLIVSHLISQQIKVAFFCVATVSVVHSLSSIISVVFVTSVSSYIFLPKHHYSTPPPELVFRKGKQKPWSSRNPDIVLSHQFSFFESDLKHIRELLMRLQQVEKEKLTKETVIGNFLPPSKSKHRYGHYKAAVIFSHFLFRI